MDGTSARTWGGEARSGEVTQLTCLSSGHSPMQTARASHVLSWTPNLRFRGFVWVKRRLKCGQLSGVVYIVLAIISLILLPPSLARQQPVVDTHLGRVRGVREQVLGRTMFSFLGIPFAEPPVGPLRFEKPQNKTPWQGTFNADQRPNSCPQVIDETYPGFAGMLMWNPNTELSEDCLHLNVWVPGELQQGARKTVMVWIFGGGFVSGTPTLDIYDGRILAAESDVIVVSINYRLGPLGFLYLSDAPGNMGLLDQQLALSWVQKNIKKFGGDPDRVTLFGESAGACSVMYHLLSPSSHELFQYAIMESVGSRKVCFKEQEHARRWSRKFAEQMDCTGPDDEAFLRCLKSDSMNATYMVEKQYEDIVDFLDFGFVPTEDGDMLGGTPWDLLEKHEFKKTSVLLGSNANEAIYWLMYRYPHIFPNKENVQLLKKRLERIVDEVYHRESKIVREAIFFEYSNQDDPYNGTYNIYIADQITGDPYFVCPTNGIAEAYVDAGETVYMYHMVHRSSTNPWPSWTGVPHGYEIEYVFGQPLNNSFGYTESEKRLSRRIMTYLSNFAKTGNPNKGETVSPAWPEYGPEHRYLEWNTKSTQTTGIGPHAKKCAFWHSYIPELREKISTDSAPARSSALSAAGVSFLLWLSFSLFHRRL